MFGRPPGPWIRAVKDYLLNLVLDGALAQDDKAQAADLARAFVAASEDHP
jgi:poly(A) polymerase